MLTQHGVRYQQDWGTPARARWRWRLEVCKDRRHAERLAQTLRDETDDRKAMIERGDSTKGYRNVEVVTRQVTKWEVVN